MPARMRRALQSMWRQWPLTLIIMLAFIVRIVGVGYGLPQPLVADETPFTYGALQMIQSHTLVPTLHPELFETVLFYPPYTSYLLLLPFVSIAALQYLLWDGAPELFSSALLTDLSAFFLAARTLNVLIGTLSVYLVYRIADSLFRSKIAATAAAFLLATSILHIALSMVGRVWVPTAFIFLAVLYALTRPWSLNRRSITASVIAGLGMGVTSLSALSIAFIGLYYILFDIDRKNMLRDWKPILISGSLFVVLAGIPWLLWHGGNVFLGSVTVSEQKTLIDLLLSPWMALSLTLFSEPILTGAFLIGLIALAWHRRDVFIFFAAMFLVYVAIFYIAFRFEPRFLAPLLPLYALVGGYAVGMLWSTRTAIALCIVALVPLAGALQLSQLALQGDTRVQAREWALKELRPDDRILVFVRAMRIPTTAAAVEELGAADASIVRRTDEAEADLDLAHVPHVLNNLVAAKEETIERLASRGAYLFYAEAHADPVMRETMAERTKDADIVARFAGRGDSTSLESSSFKDPFFALFTCELLGPDIVVYHLK